MASSKPNLSAFIASLRKNARSKGKPFLLEQGTLARLHAAPCTICNAMDTVRTNRNVAVAVYSKGYVRGNVFPVCAMCHKIRHGLTASQTVSLAARVVLACSLLGRCVKRGSAAYKGWAREVVARRGFSANPCSRAYSTNYNTYRCSAMKRCAVANGARCPSSVFTLTRQEFVELCKMPCFYCGLESANGVDRLYPAVGYTKANSVPSCKTCNYAKNDLHPARFLLHLACIVRHAGRRGGRAISGTRAAGAAWA